MKIIIGFLIGLVIHKCIIKPIEIHDMQNYLMSKGAPKPKSYKEHIWF